MIINDDVVGQSRCLNVFANVFHPRYPLVHRTHRVRSDCHDYHDRHDQISA